MSFFLLINNYCFFKDFNVTTMTILLVDDDEDDRKLFIEAAGDFDKSIKCIAAVEDARLVSVPVIVYSTSRDVKESETLKKLGAAHFMSKPVSPDEVYYMVSFVLGEKWN